MKKKILITGANGFLGSHLVSQLKSDFEIVGLVNKIDNLHRIASESIILYESREENLENVFKEHEFHALLHVATKYRRDVEPLLDLMKTNIFLPVQLLEMAIKYNVELFLNADSFFNNPSYSYFFLPDYTLSKKQSLEWIKLMAKTSTCKVVNMKIFHMYGPNDSPNKFIPNLIARIRNNEASIAMTPGNQSRDFIHVKDVVTAFEYVINNYKSLINYQEFEVGTGISSTIKELAITIKEITKSTTVLNFGGLEYRKGEIMESKVQNLGLKNTGWEPKYNLKEGLKNYIDNE